MSAFFAAIRKRRAISAYARRLPRLLIQDYGRAPFYSPAQVRRTIERAGMDTEYSCSALAMFSEQSEFDAYHRLAGENCDYQAMREEIAAVHFGGNAGFEFHDVLVLDGATDGAAGSHSASDSSGHHGQ